uniref:Uncharacterized protein n=1 Tax=Candidatus Kentrum sp. SD TaxID=2126332 RepID=A0A450YZ26_9GAMM|nr:MAG: hypothetical protein BECKSD772F_GA0070984_108216 [Candidatus Kentron sp. SD]VFK46780.1 MAG: hypothetical protein BECKSD772E_GA0070983_108016 [Candidatus Kentron sp. SD]VFK80865.1 MAG: hypothetical protein BECKSD772D_GA0070982_11697 [Candidatus Kentron sp. SD]
MAQTLYATYDGHVFTPEKEVFHVLFGVDVSDDNVRVITAYYPNLHKWESNLKTRRTVR